MRRVVERTGEIAHSLPTTVITLLPRDNSLMLRAVVADGAAVFRSERLDLSTIDAALAGDVDQVFVKEQAPPQRLCLLGATRHSRILSN